MIARIDLQTRSANAEDRQRLANLIHFESLVHRHLDWRSPLDWIGHNPYLIAEQGRKIVAALACPPDPVKVAWIRLFATASEVSAKEAWWSLWPLARDQLSDQEDIHIAAIPLQAWFTRLLEASDFVHINQVVMLLWEKGDLPPEPKTQQVNLRPMNLDDLSKVEKLDNAAFGTIWENSKESLALAYKQAAITTVAEKDGKIVGYQISTANQLGGHLARLAVDPEYQGLGIGYLILHDLLIQFERRGAQRVTVNTQQDNQVSISLYEKAHFIRTRESYPVYQHEPER
jgi:ribosomal protein S18 acetylase RimI-like enzyme